MARRKRLCMISSEAEGEPTDGQNPENSNEASDELNEQSGIETNSTHLSDHNRPFDRQSSQNESEGEAPQKKVRGPTQKNDLWEMKRTIKIVVTFNKYGIPIGDEGNELTQFLGSIVRMGDHVGLQYTDRRKVPINKKEDMYSIVKEKFVFHPAETTAIKKWIFSNMGKKLNTWRNLVKSRNYDPSLTADEILANQSDNRVNSRQFKDVVARWMTPEYQALCEQKRKSRAKMEESRVTETKSFARLAHEKAMKNIGVEPSRGEMYQQTRTRKDGTIVNEKAAQVVASLQAITSDTTNTQGVQDNDWRNDDFSKVMGPEKRGYVRMIGRTPSVKDSIASSSTSSHSVEQKLARTESVLNVMVQLFKEHIPNANLSGVLSSLNIEIPDNLSIDRSNSQNGNNRSSSGSHNDGTPSNFT